MGNNGAPGGCPTCSLDEVKIYSPASQKLTVGSIVRPYTITATVKTNHPKMLFHFLKLKSFMKTLLISAREFTN